MKSTLLQACIMGAVSLAVVLTLSCSKRGEDRSQAKEHAGQEIPAEGFPSHQHPSHDLPAMQQQAPTSEPAPLEKKTTRALYQCPMHPEYTSDKPGNCPICGMTLVPVPETKGEEMKEMPPGSVHITPDKLRQIGVAFAEVEERPLVKEIRTVARVTYDETRFKEISLKFSGWVESVFVDFTGMSVRKGQPLFSLYSPDLVTAQEEYLLALPLRESSPSLLQAARRKLSLWDLSPAQIEILEVKGKAERAMTVFSPVEGIVIEKRLVEGQFVKAGQTLYRIADISTLWLVAAVYEEDLPLLRVGQEAMAEFPSSGQMIRGQVSYISPYLDGATRTAELRIALPNRELALRPEMYATVQVHVPLGKRLAVPEDAVLDSGTSKRVFVDRGGGILEPREVWVGTRAGGYFEIVQGLKFGERVVAFANFLIDSESKLQAALGRSHSH